MKRWMIHFLGILVMGSLAGCSHGNKRGTVAMKSNDQEAHVVLGKGEVNVGDRINFFKNECLRPELIKEGIGLDVKCKKGKVGEGTVIRVLNEHYSIVQVDPGIQFQEGTIIEKADQ